ncbi:MAG: toxin-antitoxin system YwqK family antitoxin [Cryomorphaceae bacterium]
MNDTVLVFKTYDINKKIHSVKCLVRNKVEGYYYKFYDNHTISEFGYFENGLQEGVEYSFLNKKLVRERNFKNGKLHGFFYNYFYGNGNLGSSCHYISGSKTGIEVIYFKSGRVSMKKEIKDFKSNGLTIVYNKRGKPIKYRHYDNDELIWEKTAEEYSKK